MIQLSSIHDPSIFVCSKNFYMTHAVNDIRIELQTFREREKWHFYVYESVIMKFHVRTLSHCFENDTLESYFLMHTDTVGHV